MTTSGPQDVAALLLLVFGGLLESAPAQDAQAPAPQSPRLVVCGGGALPDRVFTRFRKLAGERPRLVVIPTASQRPFDLGEVRASWSKRGFNDVSVLHTRDRQTASSAEFVAPLKTATAIWFGGGQQQRIADAYLGTKVEDELYRLARRGVVIGGTSAGAAIQSRVMIASGKEEPTISKGFDLLSHSIVDQHFLRRNRIPRLMTAVRAHPQRVGLGIAEGTALVVQGERAEVVGNSFVLRVLWTEGAARVDAFGDGEWVPLGRPEAVLLKK